jgi:hypothetical protein
MATATARYFDCQYYDGSKCFNGNIHERITFNIDGLTDRQIVIRAKAELNLTGVRMRKVDDYWDVPNSMMRLVIDFDY